ncbi:MAG: M1 family metallopeptidase [Anaerolineales bacterium]|nr:M1 family metallopeptidase [Anaerolineales bacterium]
MTFITACFSATPVSPPPLPFNLVTKDPNASPTFTPFQPESATQTLLSTSTATLISTETFTLTPSPTSTLPPSPIPPPALPAIPIPATDIPPPTSTRTSYIMYATLDFNAHTLAVEETIRYYNMTGQALTDIVLSIQPNLWNNAFFLNTVTQDNVALTSYSINGQRLTLNLPQSLQAGAATTFVANYSLTIPAKRSDTIFGYDSNMINLVEWYPMIVPYSGGWVLHDPMGFGEHLVYDASDIEVNLKVIGNGVVVAASAPSEPNGDWTRYRIYGARTFVLSASDEFLVKESAVGSNVIRVYYFAGYDGAAEGMLNAAVSSVGLFQAKFAPYPYTSLSVVENDMNDGQEYDGFVFLSSDFFGQYGGSAKSNLVTIGVHEIAHQWWFGLVGNDQAMEPWLDEAMSVYSERIFYEFNYPKYLAWWWQSRVDYFGPSGYVDTNIYNGAAFRPYTNAVYLNGAHFIENLRTRMGDDDFFRFIKDYASSYSRLRATTNDFFSVAREHTSADLSDLIRLYFAGSY